MRARLCKQLSVVEQMAFLDNWALSYPIPRTALDANSLSVRARTTGQGGAGQFELRGKGIFPDGSLIANKDIRSGSIVFEVREPISGCTIHLTTEYPVSYTGGKTRISIQEKKEKKSNEEQGRGESNRKQGQERPNVGNLFTSLLLLPEVSKVNASTMLRKKGFSKKAFWMDTAEVKPVGTSDNTVVLELTRLFFATGNRDDSNQFSAAIEYDFESRIRDIVSVCKRGSKIKADSISAALKYFSDVFEGALNFDYEIANFFTNKIKERLASDDAIGYMDGDDLLPALNQFIELELRKQGDSLGGTKRYFNLVDLPAAFMTGFSRRFITSLLAKPFVILTGNSGTGKTRIAKRFAKYLEVLDEHGEPNWLLVPVGADWTDNTKVLGFYNPLGDGGAGSYEETEILRLIKRANANPNVPFFLILDEMNLSHVERYFSDFLSHMETADGCSPLALDGYNKTCSNDAPAEELVYPQNLFVIGTVNIDETTYMFSPKVLDRANVIEFKPSKDDVLAWFNSSDETPGMATAAPGISSSFLRLAKDIQSGTDYISEIDAAIVTDIFSQLYDALEKCGYEFAYRTVREVRKYINAAHELDGDDFELSRSIDEQIVQKVLPKIHGNRREIKELLSELASVCDGNLSSNKIRQMQTKLDSVQYASFI